ncbi:MAG TPA: 50S ribosomal protein L4 [Candidatus Paceibacterota bacterium]|nr:50S ribosomal protein L4 [Candidatus Paceibacterota bacterium]
MKNETKAVKKAAAPKAKAPKAAKASVGLEATIYNTKGASAGTVKLPEKVFGLPWNADLVHQVMHSMMSTARQPIAHTKTRGEVRGGGKKPWRQKGTGRARHGSTRSPLWVGGGVAHGPRNDKNYDRKVNKGAKAKAFLTLLSKKYRDGEVIFVESLSFSAPKTAEAISALAGLAKNKDFSKLVTKPKNAAFIALSKKDVNVEKSFRNVRAVSVDEVRNVNLLDVLTNKFLVIENPTESLKVIENKI